MKKFCRYFASVSSQSKRTGKKRKPCVYSDTKMNILLLRLDISNNLYYKTAKKYPDKLRLIEFFDEETDKTYRFVTNNFNLATSTIIGICKQRWQIGLFFKWIKQNLKIKSFPGTSENAVMTQIWITLIYHSSNLEIRLLVIVWHGLNLPFPDWIGGYGRVEALWAAIFRLYQVLTHFFRKTAKVFAGRGPGCLTVFSLFCLFPLTFSRLHSFFASFFALTIDIDPFLLHNTPEQVTIHPKEV